MILGIIRRSFHYLNQDMLLKLYKSMVRPHLEYCVAAWSPHLLQDTSTVESVQHRATRLLSHMRHLEYEERLKILDLPSLSYRRLRGDLILVYKSIHNDTLLKPILPLETVRLHNTRGHPLRLKKQHCNTSIRKFFFSERVINHWNS